MDLSKESRYFIALVPPTDICKHIFEYKKLIAEKFNSKGALRSEAHITLHMPFLWPNKRLEELVTLIETIASQSSYFEIETNSFGFFEPRVVYIDIIKTNALKEIQNNLNSLMRNKLNLKNSNYKDDIFNPHITIGFRDLKKQIFPSAKEYFESCSFKTSWTQTNISLLEYKTERWNINKSQEFMTP